jgi:hypothetical protein
MGFETKGDSVAPDWLAQNAGVLSYLDWCHAQALPVVPLNGTVVRAESCE